MSDPMPRRVAVIAVHGVGHHRPLEAARSVADLLATTPGHPYTPFIEHPVRVPVAAVDVSDTCGKRRQSRLDRIHEEGESEEVPFLAFLDERAEFLRDVHATRVKPESPELHFMCDQLEKYKVQGEDSIYETAFYSSTRHEAGGDIAVNVFDMYWTDLSRVSTAGLRMIGELYQLLFYVCGLGRKTLDFACSANTSNTPLFVLSRLQTWAERFLALFIPIGNLCALGLFALAIPQLLAAAHVGTIGEAPISLLGGSIVLFALAIFALTLAAKLWSPGEWWPWWFPIGLIGSAVIAYAVLTFPPSAVQLVLAELCWAVAAAAILALMWAYGLRRPGAFRVSVTAVGAVTALIFLAWVLGREGRHDATDVGLLAGTWVYIAIESLWEVFMILAIAVSLLGFFVAIKSKVNGKDEGNRLSRAVWTANLSLFLPGLLVMVLNLALWWGLFKAAPDKLGELKQLKEQVRPLLADSTPWAFVVVLGLAAIAFLTVVWALLPCVFGEVFPRVAAGKGAAPLGRTLSESFRTMRWTGEAMRIVFVALLPISYVYDSWALGDPLGRSLAAASQASTLWIGLALIVMMTGPGVLRGLALGLRTAIDVAIDVANWLRVYPLENNPRARISARFTSLLRHIIESKEGYERIVIVSHSQGTVISSELLRFLHEEGIPLAAAPGDGGTPAIHLFTMGCPLRQLYSQRFPDQYAWGRYPGGNSNDPDPAPSELGVVSWVNAYRSGDYIGRYLWHCDEAGAWAAHAYTNGARREICIGAGAHTHYWDDSAPQVRDELNRLIL